MSDSTLRCIDSHLEANLPFVSDHGSELAYKAGSLRIDGEYVFATFTADVDFIVDMLEFNLGRIEYLEDEKRLLAHLGLIEERFRPFDGEHRLLEYRLFEPGLFDLTNEASVEGLRAAAELRTLRPSKEVGVGRVRPPKQAGSVCYAPEGRTVVALEYDFTTEGGWIGEYEVESDTWLEILPQDRFTDSFVECLPDGSVVLAGRNGLCRLDRESGSETWITDPSFESESIHSVDAFFRGQILVTCELRGAVDSVPWVRITDLESESFQTAFDVRRPTGASPRSAAVGQESDILYLIGRTDSQTWLDVWSLSRGERVKSMGIAPQLPKDPPTLGYERGRIAVSPEGDHVAVAAGAAYLLSMESGEVVWEHRPARGYFGFVGFLPDARVVASGPVAMEVLDAQTGTPEVRDEAAQGTYDMTVSPNGHHFTLLASDGLQTYRLPGVDRLERADDRAARPRDLAASPRSDTFAAAYRDCVRLWHIDDGSATWCRRLPNVRTVEFSTDGRVVFALADEHLTRLDASSGEVLSNSSMQVDALYPGYETTFGIALQTVFRGKTTRSRLTLYDVEEDSELNVVECPLTSGTPLLDYHGRLAVLECTDSAGTRGLQTWDLRNGTQLWGREVAVGSAFLSRGGNRIARIESNEIIIYDARSGERLGSREIHISWDEPLEFSPDGRFVAVTDSARDIDGGDIALYELVALGATSVGLVFRRRIETNYFNGVEDICFTHDGQTLLAAMEDGAVVVTELGSLF